MARKVPGPLVLVRVLAAIGDQPVQDLLHAQGDLGVRVLVDGEPAIRVQQEEVHRPRPDRPEHLHQLGLHLARDQVLAPAHGLQVHRLLPAVILWHGGRLFLLRRPPPRPMPTVRVRFCVPWDAGQLRALRVSVEAFRQVGNPVDWNFASEEVGAGHTPTDCLRSYLWLYFLPLERPEVVSQLRPGVPVARPAGGRRGLAVDEGAASTYSRGSSPAGSSERSDCFKPSEPSEEGPAVPGLPPLVSAAAPVQEGPQEPQHAVRPAGKRPSRMFWTDFETECLLSLVLSYGPQFGEISLAFFPYLDSNRVKMRLHNILRAYSVCKTRLPASFRVLVQRVYRAFYSQDSERPGVRLPPADHQFLAQSTLTRRNDKLHLDADLKHGYSSCPAPGEPWNDLSCSSEKKRWARTGKGIRRGRLSSSESGGESSGSSDESSSGGDSAHEMGAGAKASVRGAPSKKETALSSPGASDSAVKHPVSRFLSYSAAYSAEHLCGYPPGFLPTTATAWPARAPEPLSASVVTHSSRPATQPASSVLPQSPAGCRAETGAEAASAQRSRVSNPGGGSAWSGRARQPGKSSSRGPRDSRGSGGTSANLRGRTRPRTHPRSRSYSGSRSSESSSSSSSSTSFEAGEAASARPPASRGACARPREAHTSTIPKSTEGVKSAGDSMSSRAVQQPLTPGAAEFPQDSALKPLLSKDAPGTVEGCNPFHMCSQAVGPIGYHPCGHPDASVGADALLCQLYGDPDRAVISYARELSLAWHGDLQGMFDLRGFPELYREALGGGGDRAGGDGSLCTKPVGYTIMRLPSSPGALPRTGPDACRLPSVFIRSQEPTASQPAAICSQIYRDQAEGFPRDAGDAGGVGDVHGKRDPRDSPDPPEPPGPPEPGGNQLEGPSTPLPGRSGDIPGEKPGPAPQNPFPPSGVNGNAARADAAGQQRPAGAIDARSAFWGVSSSSPLLPGPMSCEPSCSPAPATGAPKALYISGQLDAPSIDVPSKGPLGPGGACCFAHPLNGGQKAREARSAVGALAVASDSLILDERLVYRPPGGKVDAPAQGGGGAASITACPSVATPIGSTTSGASPQAERPVFLEKPLPGKGEPAQDADQIPESLRT